MDDDTHDPDARASVANEPIHLATEPVTITLHTGQTEPAEAYVRFVMLPSPGIELQATFGADYSSDHGLLSWNVAGTVRVDFPDRGASVELLQRAVRIPDGPHLVAIVGSDEITTPASGPALRLAFRVLNFEDFFSTVVPSAADVRQFREAVALEAGGWRVVIAKTPHTQQTVKALRERGGYGVTHAGELVRADGAAFDVHDAEDVLLSLHYLLAFARGRWAPLIAPVAYAGDGTRVWERWQVPASDAWGGNSTWFDRQHGNQLAELFPGFWALWRNPTWNAVLPRAVHWFVSSDAGDGGIEGGLILSCTALELLAWVTLVEDRQLLTADDFNRLKGRAAARLRRLLTTLDIPTDVPAETQELRALAAFDPNEVWDGPTTVTRVRNAVVHPEARDRASTATEEQRYQAWKLAQWYVELVLLALCGYTGTYGNRLPPSRWSGQVEPVPWASANPGSQ